MTNKQEKTSLSALADQAYEEALLLHKAAVYAYTDVTTIAEDNCSEIDASVRKALANKAGQVAGEAGIKAKKAAENATRYKEQKEEHMMRIALEIQAKTSNDMLKKTRSNEGKPSV